VSRWLPLWLLLSFGASFGLNRATKTSLPLLLSAGERTMPTGSLWFEDAEGRHELKLVTIHVLTRDLHRRFGSTIVVRELWLRAPEQDGQPAPDLELFFDFDADRNVALERREINQLTRRPLPLVPVALGTEVRSRVRPPGANAPSFVTGGQMMIEEALPLEVQSGSATWHVEGSFELSMIEDGVERRVHGNLSARLVWE
jgi:hypothetical protein